VRWRFLWWKTPIGVETPATPTGEMLYSIEGLQAGFFKESRPADPFCIWNLCSHANLPGEGKSIFAGEQVIK
jgi:hypothetical protein